MKNCAVVAPILMLCLGLNCLANTVSYTDTLQTVEQQMATGANFVITGPSSNSFIKAASTDNLVSIRLDDVEIRDVIMMFTRISGANIASRANLQGRVTANLTDIEWRQALNLILDVNALELTEYTAGSGVYSVVPRRNYESMGHLLFRAPGDLSPTNSVSLNLTNATLNEVLCEIARQAHINICHAPNASDTGDFTIAFTNADSRDALVQIAAMQQAELTWSLRLNAYVVGARLAAARVYPTTESSTTDLDAGSGTIILLVVCGVFLWSLVRRDRKDSSGTTPPNRSSWLGLWFLTLLYGILLFEGIFGLMLADKNYVLKLFTGGVFLSIIVFTIAIRIRKACRAMGWHPRGARRAIVWCLAYLPLMVFFMDSQPLAGDYTWQDLPTPKQNATESYALLEKIYGTHPIDAKPNLPDLYNPTVSSNILAYAAQIEQAWTDLRELRDVVDRLAAFDDIADLSKPELRITDFYYIYAGPKTLTLHDIGNVYAAYISLRTRQGRTEEAATALGIYHTAIRKILPNARGLVLRMICVGNIERDTRLAWQIIEKSGNDPRIATILGKAFRPVRHTDVSIKTSLLAEYLAKKDLLHRCRGEEWLAVARGFHEEWRDGTWIPFKPATFFEGIASRVVWFATVRRNRTIDDLRQHCQVLMDKAADAAPGFAATEKLMDQYRKRPPLTNLGGWLFVNASSPSYTMAAASCTRAKILTDLLAIEINQRVGEQLSFNDPYTGKPYDFDESRHSWFSVGPDRKPHTKDDICIE